MISMLLSILKWSCIRTPALEHLFNIYKKSFITKSYFRFDARVSNSRSSILHLRIWMKMDIYCFTYCAFICIITIRLFYAVNANANDETIRTEIYTTKGNTKVLLTENTTDVYSRSMISCANTCFLNPQCCTASYLKETSTCRIDTSSSCCTKIEPDTGWRFIRRISYPYCKLKYL